VSVKTISLDDFCFKRQGIRPLSAIKINAEGAELEVLLGGRATIEKFTFDLLVDPFL